MAFWSSGEGDKILRTTVSLTRASKTRTLPGLDGIASGLFSPFLLSSPSHCSGYLDARRIWKKKCK